MWDREIKQIWEENAEIWSTRVKKQLTDARSVKEGWADLVLSCAPREGSLQILDCGTGPGLFPIALGERGHHVTGIDISENMIREAEKNIRTAKVDAELLIMDCHETAFPDEHFDMVISRSCTWTLSDPPKAYREWKRILKRGGRLVIMDGNFYLHLHDKERFARFEDLNARMKEERGVGIFTHKDQKDSFSKIGKDLFMSSKQRPLWDLGYLMELGFSRVFAIPDIRSFIPGALDQADELDRELSDLSPMFLVGAQK